jgi:hypothetical protein
MCHRLVLPSAATECGLEVEPGKIRSIQNVFSGLYCFNGGLLRDQEWVDSRLGEGTIGPAGVPEMAGINCQSGTWSSQHFGKRCTTDRRRLLGAIELVPGGQRALRPRGAASRRRADCLPAREPHLRIPALARHFASAARTASLCRQHCQKRIGCGSRNIHRVTFTAAFACLTRSRATSTLAFHTKIERFPRKQRSPSAAECARQGCRPSAGPDIRRNNPLGNKAPKTLLVLARFSCHNRSRRGR